MKNLSAVAGKCRLFGGAGIAALSLGLLSSPAFGQDTVENDPNCVDADEDGVCDPPQSADAGSPTTSDGLIIVSGSRIARPNLDSPVPVTSVEANELLNDGALSLGDALNDLPSLRSTFNTSNSQRFIGTTGLNILDLRGLGTSRTLTLVNGRRHITASPGDFQVDVNTIPFELLERVDVVTGGSSAVYGSDAIAGVVNFVLKRDFEGLELNGQAGISSRGDTPRYSISGAWGKNFADGRGNIAVAAEYSKIGRVFNSQRPDISGFGIGFTSFEQVDFSDPSPSNSDGNPDNVLTNNLFIDFISEGGTIQTLCFDPAVQPLACDAGGNSASLRFDQNGRLYREANNPFPSGLAQGGTGSALADGTLIPDIERYNFNVLFHFDVSDAFRPYAEFKYARIDALGQGTPSFFNGFCAATVGALAGLTANGGCAPDDTRNGFFVNFDNPFLNPADIPTIRAVQDELLQFFGFPPGLGGAISQGFLINRNNTDFGTRNDKVKRQTYRIVAGIEGDISSNTRYDLSFTYGKFKGDLVAQNNLVYERARNAVDAVLSGGNIVCRINADGITTNDDPACVPINIFGQGAPSQAALDYVNTVATLTDRAEQIDILGYVSTDSSPWFELPGGPIRLVVGGEWRQEKASQVPDAFSATGATFFNSFGTFLPPKLEVFEAFGEIEFPILANMPFADELTLSAAGRISDYNSAGGATGTVEAYNLNAIYSPIPDIRFRANYSRAVRAPTLSDLFSAPGQNFLFLTDPCDARRIGSGSPTRAANCLADGVPVGYIDRITSSNAIIQAGNPALQAETSDSYTVGVVLEPRFIPGFTASIDYYNITVDKVITSPSGTSILNNCYDAPTLVNPFCALVNPREATGDLNFDSALTRIPINFAKLKAEGIDLDVRYRHTFENDDRLDLRLISTYVLDRTNFLDLGAATSFAGARNTPVPNRVRGELGDPKWAFNFNASYSHGPVKLSYGLRWIGPQTIGAWENYFPYTTLCPTSGVVPQSTATCTPGNLVTANPLDPDFTAEVFYPIRAYHDVRLDWEIEDRFNFYFGVDNLTDKLPPFALTGAGDGSGIFNNTGRYFFAGVNVEF